MALEPVIRSKLCRSEAERVLKECVIGGPPVPIEVVVQRHGFRLIRRSDWERSGTRDARILPSTGVIEYSMGYWPRVRFSIAHELGHYVLRHGVDTFPYASEEGAETDTPNPDKLMHREAELFAAHLLMPRTWLTDDVKRGVNPKALQKRYEVSDSALWIALTQYRLVRLLKPS